MAQDTKLALVADDNDQVLELVARVLELRATRCAGDERGRRRAGAASDLDNLCLVTLDVDMSPGSGLDVLDLVRHLRPELPTIMMSGDTTYQEFAGTGGKVLGTVDRAERPRPRRSPSS